MRQHGIEYALINLKFAVQNGRDEALPQGVVGNERMALQRWYAGPESSQEPWRRLLGDAPRRGLWTAEFAQNGVVALRIGEAGQTGKGTKQTSAERGGAL